MAENNTFIQPENQTLPEPTKRLEDVREVNDSWVAPKLGTPQEQRQEYNQRQSSTITDNIFENINNENEQLLSQGLIARADANPARYLHATKTAEAMGIDNIDFVYDNLDEFEKQRKEQEKERYIRRCDNLKEMCIDDPTLLAKLDDVSAGQLKRINDNLVIYGGVDRKTGLSGKWARTSYTFKRAEQDFETNELAYDLIGTRGAERAEKIRLLQEAESKLEDMPELDTSGWNIGDLTLNAVEQMPYQLRTTGAMVAGTVGGAVAGTFTTSPVGGVVAGYAGNAAGRAIAYYEGYKAESGNIMRELLKVKDTDGKPLDDDIVDVASRFYGGFSSMIEQVGAAALLKPMGLGNLTKIGLKNAIKEALKDKTKREIFIRIAKDFTSAITAESAEEFMQQLLQSNVERAAKDFARLTRDDNYDEQFFIDGLLDDLALAGEAGLQGAKASIVLAGAPSMVRTGVAATRQYRNLHSKVRETKAIADMQILDDTQKKVQAYAESEAYEPKTLGALFQRAKRESIYQDVFVSVDDAKALMQSDAMQNNKETLTKNGLWADMERQIAEGEELGTPVRIGFADFGEKVMPSADLYAAWKDVIKTYEDGVTLKEIKAKQAERASWLAEGQKRAANKDANFEFAYKKVLENAVYANMPEMQRRQQAELTAGILCYLAEQSNANIQEFVNQHLPQYELSLDGDVSSGANVKDIIKAVRDEAIANETQNLINVSKRVARKDINAIKKLLLSKIDNPNTADVKKYVQIVNAISDMKLNIEGMSDEDIIKHLAEYTKGGELTLDIKRDDTDRAKSGLYSASETALADIQANGGDGDYVLVGGGRVPVNYEIIDLNDMVTSHNDAGAINENYPQELQPRDRSRSASDVQIASIVRNFAPERVAKTEIATEGAPIVTKEGFVAVGNGRAMAIRQVYNNEATAQTYKDYLSAKGFDLSGFDKPVLVRRLTMDMNTEQLRALVDDANTAGTMQYSDSENALRDAAKMSGNLIDLLDIDADIDSAANKRFLTGFFSEVVPTAERNAYLDKDDKITRKGVERVENALVAKLLPDARFLSVLVENPDNNIRKVTKSLAKAVPAIIGFENDIAAGRIDAQYSIASDVAGAVEVLKRAKDKGVSAGDFIKMTDMFAEPIPASTQVMVQLFENTTGATDFLNKILGYIHNASDYGDLEQGNMFTSEPMTKLQLLEREAAQQALFQKIATSLFSPKRADERTYISDLRAVERGEKNSLRVGELPAVYRSLGLSAGMVRTNKDVILKDTIDKHNVPEAVVENLPKLFADPIMVFQSSTKQGRLLAVVDAQDNDGNQIVVAISPNTRGVKGYHFIPSFYGKDNFENFVNRNIESGNLKYVKSLEELDTHYLSSQAKTLLGSVSSSITQKADIVNSNNVYHQSAFAGSRVDYDKPSLEAIGTGEGAQVHGWGLYYALSRAVAERYRRTFLGAKYDGIDWNQTVIGKYNDAIGNALLAGCKDKVLKYFEDALNKAQTRYDNLQKQDTKGMTRTEKQERKDSLENWQEKIVKYSEAVDFIKNFDESKLKTEGGQVHEVDLPENPYLLDEELQINQQSETVRKAVRAIMNQYEDYYIASDDYSVGAFGDALTGERFYKQLMNIAARNGIDSKNKQMQFATQTLEKYGIKGITYEGMQDGRCFVIFNPKDVKVIQKFYQNIGTDALGAYLPLERKIVLFRNHNLSTIIHESGHWWLDMLQQVAQTEQASDKLKSDWATIKEWLGVGEDNVISEEQHEKFARGVEAYFMTRKAPSSKLAELFDTFRRWLTSVYKDVKELDVELNDDVVRVFNHMLASEAEIEEYKQANNLKEMFDRADVFGLDPKDFERYKELAENSMTLAKNKHFNDKMLLIYKEEQEAYAKLKEQLTAQVRDEWCSDKYNRAIYAIYRGKVGDIDIGEISINEAEMRELFGENLKYLQKRDGKPIYASDGLSFQDVADLVGLSVDELKGTLLSVRNRTRKYKELLDRRTHEELGDPVSYDDVQKQVVASVYNDKQANLLHFELNNIGKTLGKKSVLEQGYEVYARNKIANMRIKDLKPQSYAEQAQKAGDKALQAMERGNRESAYRFKEMQIRNFYLYREAQKQFDLVEKAVKRLKQIGKKEVNIGVEQTYQDAARALLSKVDLARALNSKQQERLGNLAMWVIEQRQNGYEIVVPDKFLHEINKINYTELTVDDFIGLSDSVKSLIHNGRDIKEFELAGQLVDREKLLAEMAKTLEKHGKIEKTASSRKSKTEVFAKFWRGLDSFLTGIGFVANRIDNGDTNGIFHKTFVRPLANAQTLENDLQVKYAKKITDLTAGLSKETKARMRDFVPEAEKILRGKYTLEDLITIGLNMGNKDNLQRLQDGNGFSDNQLNWVKNYLTKEHWDYIQAIWDVLESMYPMLEEHHKKMSGLDMDKVFPIPVQTSYGQYRGGYFPIVYDREFSPDMESKAALYDADYNVATTSKGYTKKRVNKVDAPIKLGLMNVAQHMNTVLHDVAYRGTLRKLWTLANNPEFVAMFDDTIGKEYRDNLNELLKTLGNEPNRETRGLAAWEKCLRFMRQRATLIGLGFRLTTALSQPLGFFSSIATMTEHKQKQGGKHGGAYYIALGHKELLTNPKIYDWAMACSGELRARLGNQDASIAKRIKELTKNAGNMTFKEQAETWAYKAIGYMDFYVANVTWIGAYRQATNEFNMKHEDAVFYADRVMLNSQGTGTTKDTAGIQRANEGWRALTMFYSFFSALYQNTIQFGRDVKTAKSFADYADLSARFMAMVVIPACLDSLMRGELPDDDDDSFLAWLFDNTFGYFIGGVPVARDIYSGLKYKNSGGSNVGRQVNYFGNFASALAKAFDGDPNWQKISKNAMNSFAVVTGYPTGGQVADTTSYFVGVAAGEIKPQSLTDLLWGIYKGKERKQ